jgi:hypothetical protein
VRVRLPVLATAVLTALALALGGCSVDASAPGAERTALLAPDFVASAAAGATDDPQAKWLLRQPRAVRAGFVHEVLDRKGGRDLLSQAWLLHQSDAVRASYVHDVVAPQLR